MKKTTIAILLIASILLLTASTPPKFNVNLHGGQFGTKSMTMWELHKYKDTTLLRKTPLKYCPYKAYQLVNQCVEVHKRNNIHYIDINADLIELTAEDANYNKAHAKVYKGTTEQKVKKIYRYCTETTYRTGKKYARSVFEDREGDCAGIASAFYVLCIKNEIPVRYVIGWCPDGCHAWNRVKVNGKWYWIDPTLERYLWKDLYEGYSILEYW